MQKGAQAEELNECEFVMKAIDSFGKNKPVSACRRALRKPAWSRPLVAIHFTRQAVRPASGTRLLACPAGFWR
jgi:hypothetical protein